MQKVWVDTLFHVAEGISFLLYIAFLMHWANGAKEITKHEGKIKRGYKLWSKPLTPKQIQSLRELPNGIIEQPGESTSNVLLLSYPRVPTLLIKQNQEIMICGGMLTKRGNPSFLERIFMGILVGYADIGLPEPELEFRIPVKIKWLVVFILIPILILVPISFSLYCIEGIEHTLNGIDKSSNRATQAEPQQNSKEQQVEELHTQRIEAQRKSEKQQVDSFLDQLMEEQQKNVKKP